MLAGGSEPRLELGRLAGEPGHVGTDGARESVEASGIVVQAEHEQRVGVRAKREHELIDRARRASGVEELLEQEAAQMRLLGEESAIGGAQ